MNDFTPRQATLLFWSATGLCSLLWIVLPGGLLNAYRPDVVELQFIAKEWVLSTRKHPMLPAWILEILNLITGRVFVAPFIASQLCVLLTLWSVWTLGRQVLSERLALLGTLAMLPYWFFTVESLKYNQNIVLMAFWSLAILLVFQAFRTDRRRYWIGAGPAIGLTFHAKYTAAFLVLAILVFMVLSPRARRYWKTPGPYATMAIAFLVFLPHVIWQFLDDFTGLQYAQTGLSPKSETINHLLLPLEFIAREGGYLLLSVLILLPVLGIPGRWKRYTPEEETGRDARRFLALCIGLPFFLHVLIAGVMKARLNAEYGAAFWPYFGILLLLTFRANPTRYRLSVTAAVLGEVFLLIAFVLMTEAGPYLSGKASRIHYPMVELAATCDRLWREHYPEIPCPYITGDWIPASYAGIWMKDRPSVHFYFPTISDPQALPSGTWSKDEDVIRRGGIILWELDPKTNDPDEVPRFVHERFPSAEVLDETIRLPHKTGADIPPVTLGIALLPPQDVKPSDMSR